MNGRALPVELMKAALDGEKGLRIGKLLSDVSIFEIPDVDRLILISDVAMIVSPGLAQKVAIVQNAIDTAIELGIERPKVAILAATEMVSPEMPANMDAANLSKMAERGQIRGGIVDGPLALDNAMSLKAAKMKGINSPVAGQADVLITPDVEQVVAMSSRAAPAKTTWMGDPSRSKGRCLHRHTPHPRACVNVRELGLPVPPALGVCLQERSDGA
jgi:phosphate butyryltransferase